MQRALVIAITRLGDLIQTEPFLRALKTSKRAAHVSLLVERNFVSIAERLTGADEVIAIDFTKMLGALDRSQRDLPLQDYLCLANELAAGSFDEVWNLTHTRPAMVLTSLAGSKQAQGVALDATGLQIVHNEWLTYFFATNLARPWSAFNLVDIYVNSVSADWPFAARIPKLRDVSHSAKPRPRTYGAMHVLLHPGASQSDKQWPVTRFVDTAKWLLERGASVTLIGGSKERQLVEFFPKHRRLTSRIGETTIPELIDACSGADLLISADSGPVHVAAACGTPVIAIEGGTAHGYETAPYNTNSCVLQPHLSRLLTRRPDKQNASGSAEDISSEMVTSVIQYMAGERKLPLSAPNVSVYGTQIDSYAKGLALNRITGGPAEYDEQLGSLRSYWLAALSSSERLTVSSTMNKFSELILKCAKYAEQIARSGSSWQQTERSAGRLTSAERSLSAYINEFPHLHHVNMFLQIARSSLSAGDPYMQATELASLYKRMAAGAALCQVESGNTKRIQTNSAIEVPA